MCSLGDVPIRVKAAVVDKFVGIQRIKEEKVLLSKVMMTNFMAFYPDSVLPKLHEQDSQIRDAISTAEFPIFIRCVHVRQIY